MLNYWLLLIEKFAVVVGGGGSGGTEGIVLCSQ